jgi:TIR domain
LDRSDKNSSMISASQSFSRMLMNAKYSVEACVVVGGTILLDHYKQIKECALRGIKIRFLFPDPHSSWLIPIISATGYPIKSYQKRIISSAHRAHELGMNTEIRWHSQPINKWFVIADRTIVASKPFDITMETLPAIEARREVIRYYIRLFDTIWTSASTERTQVTYEVKAPNNQLSKLRVFLCHSSEDKPAVRSLYNRLVKLGVDCWLDERKLLAGQNWQREIRRALKDAHVVIICLSRKSVKRKGYMQKELKDALEIAQEYPDGTVYVIPTRLDDCLMPEGLCHLQWVDIYEDEGYNHLLESLRFRANEIIDSADTPEQ